MKNKSHPFIVSLAGLMVCMVLNEISGFCQIPNGLSYQTVLYNASGNVRANAEVSITISILQGSAAGSSIYSEAHNLTTSGKGSINLQLGAAEPADFADIDWGQGPYFLKTEVDGSWAGTVQLLSVPYALYAESSETLDLLEELDVIPENFAGTVTDIEGNVYKTITIGTQTWMAENLRTVHFNDSTPIQYPDSDIEWQNETGSAVCFYGYGLPNTYTSVTCGALYNYIAVYSDKLCPAGWRVPTYNEWGVLADYLGGDEVAGGKLKESGTTHWESPNEEATNEINFAALPGGYRNISGSYAAIGNLGYWWTATIDIPPEASFFGMSRNNGELYRGAMDVRSGFSVRCIKE